MPPRRRLTHISAAALPASRLPLGTPTLVKSPQYTDSNSTSQKQIQQGTSASSLRKEKSADSDQTSTDIFKPNDMAAKQEPELMSAKSIADAKLERQQKRIEEGDIVPRRKQGVRGKAKQWKPFDFTADVPKVNESHDGGVPVSEVRINTFRPLSRETSSVRSESLISQRTNDTAPSDRDMETQDSVGLDSSFQVVRRRGQRKDLGELNAYENSPEKRQTTVEASFDSREIYEVFGNALPNPRFIEENAGTKNGEVQFIQHPNGDVSAHQWSNDRFMWENIGQFSNIRKKIEGQLASDRLRGETAYHTLQQNTLAYFRTIAKQREAMVMGLPFGAKEVQAAMPQQQPEKLASAPTWLTESPKVAIPLKPSQAQAKDYGAQTSTLHPPARSFMPQNILQRQMSYGPSWIPPDSSYDDPFYSTSNYQQIYGTSPYSSQYQQPQTTYQATSSHALFGIAQRPQGVNYNFQFPPVVPSSQASHFAGGQFESKASAAPSSNYTLTQQHPYMGPSPLPNFRPPSNPARYGRPPTEIAAPQPKPVVPFGSRGSMSDQLWKISETAKERNLSQTNIARTVMHDPFLKKNEQLGVGTTNEVPRQGSFSNGPMFIQSISGQKLQPPSSFDPTSANFFPTVLALPRSESPEQVQASSLVTAAAENVLEESSPDAYESTKSYDFSTPFASRAAQLQPTPQNFNGPFFPAEEDSNGTNAKAKLSNTTKKTYDEELQDWWTSGNKFERQQKFFESIMAAQKTSDSGSSINSPPAHLTPIGPPKKKGPPPFNPVTTRLMIPMLENLASYVQGPVAKRRDYFCPWSDPPEWAIDNSPGGNDSFIDPNWGEPPARVGRDPRYQNQSWDAESTPPTARYNSMTGGQRSSSGFGMSATVGSGIDRRFSFAGRY